jgi:hypothetical protein
MRQHRSATAWAKVLTFAGTRTGPREGAELNGLSRRSELPLLDPG